MDFRASEQAAIEGFRDWVRDRFGPRVRALTLYGSRARGEGDEESDLDVLVVVEELTGAEAKEVCQMAGDALTRHDVILSPLAVSREHLDLLRSRERQLVREIDRDGVHL